MTDKQISDVLKAPMRAYTAVTITDAQGMRQEIAKIRDASYAEDHGEYNPNTGAFAAPILAPSGKVLAALSVVFLVDHVNAGSIRDIVLQAAGAISRDFGAADVQMALQ